MIDLLLQRNPGQTGILLLSDTAHLSSPIDALLPEVPARCHRVSSLAQGLKILDSQSIALILLALESPTLAMEIAQAVRVHPLAKGTPILFILSDSTSSIEPFEGCLHGPVSCLSIDLAPELIINRILYCIEFTLMRRELAYHRRQLNSSSMAQSSPCARAESSNSKSVTQEENSLMHKQPPANPSKNQPNYRVTLLVVDDDAANRSLMKGYLRALQLDVLEAKNGEEGVDIALHFQPDLILMDLKMPVLDGNLAARCLKKEEKTKDIPIVALTALPEREARQKLDCSNFWDLLCKPIQKKRVVELVTSLFPQLLIPPPQAEEPSSIGGLQGAQSPAIIDQLSSHWFDELNRLAETCFFDDFEQFGQRLAQFGDQHQLPAVVEYAKELVEAAARFEIQALKKSIAAFPTLLTRIQ